MWRRRSPSLCRQNTGVQCMQATCKKRCDAETQALMVWGNKTSPLHWRAPPLGRQSRGMQCTQVQGDVV